MLQLRLTRAQRVFGTWPDGIKSIEYKELYSFGDAWKGCSLPFALIFLVTFRLRFCSTDCSVHNINARSERGATEELLTVLWWGRAGRGSGTAKLVKGMEGLSYKELLSKTGSLSIWKVGDWWRTGQRSLNLWQNWMVKLGPTFQFSSNQGWRGIKWNWWVTDSTVVKQQLTFTQRVGHLWNTSNWDVTDTESSGHDESSVKWLWD